MENCKMKNTEYRKFKEHILDHMESVEKLSSTIEDYKTLPESEGNFWKTIDTMCQYGLFDVYYDQCLETLKEVYGDEFDESKYITKDRQWRWKNNEAYIWTIYKAKIAKTIETMIKKGEL